MGRGRDLAAVVVAALVIGCSESGTTENAQKGSDAKAAGQPVEAQAAPPQSGSAPAAPKVAIQPGTLAPAGENREEIGRQIKRYYVRSGQIPDDVNIAVAELKKSQVTGLNEGVLELSKGDQSQKMPFLITADGMWFLRADPVNLTVDPVKDVIDKIKISADDPSLGPENSKVTIVEYSDFQCPFCSRAQSIVDDEVLKAYGDKVRFVYKQYPLTQIHPWAETASLMGLCIHKKGGNDKYWKFHRAIFTKQREIKDESANDDLMKLVAESGADPAAIKACVDAGETKAILERTLAEAEAIGVNSTPMFFINGRRLAGAQPLAEFKAIIDPELSSPQP